MSTIFCTSQALCWPVLAFSNTFFMAQRALITTTTVLTLVPHILLVSIARSLYCFCTLLELLRFFQFNVLIIWNHNIFQQVPFLFFFMEHKDEHDLQEWGDRFAFSCLLWCLDISNLFRNMFIPCLTTSFFTVWPVQIAGYFVVSVYILGWSQPGVCSKSMADGPLGLYTHSAVGKDTWVVSLFVLLLEIVSDTAI